MTTRWTAEQAHMVDAGHARIPVVTPADVHGLVEGWWFWDLWPVRELHGGAVTEIEDGELWMALSAPAEGHPGGRHDHARVRLLHRTAAGWHDRGPVFPDGFTRGSREWAGSAWHVDGEVVVDHTAAGVRGEASTTFRQRLETATAQLGPGPTLSGWRGPSSLVEPDGVRYHPADEAVGGAGFIKAFRDPFRFIDDDGSEHLLFTASLASSATGFDGLVGLATHDGDRFVLEDPILSADAVNNELERPHLIRHEGRYLLFISTQARTFHPDVAAPSGLYGWTADAVDGPYTPLNGSGLVMATPLEEPTQTYSWLVLPDLTVSSFIDNHSLGGRTAQEIDAQGDAAARAHFGGTLAPSLQLWVEGDRAGLLSAG